MESLACNAWIFSLTSLRKGVASSDIPCYKESSLRKAMGPKLQAIESNDLEVNSFPQDISCT